MHPRTPTSTRTDTLLPYTTRLRSTDQRGDGTCEERLGTTPASHGYHPNALQITNTRGMQIKVGLRIGRSLVHGETPLDKKRKTHHAQSGRCVTPRRSEEHAS